jgi:CheY-like chemotaxis protein
MAMILIVEDEAFTREMAGMCIDDWGHGTLFADSVENALVHVRSGQAIDALFTDIHLKAEKLGGCNVAREAIALHPNLRVLYTTGNKATDELKAQFVSGAHFLSKPYTPDQLQTGVTALLSA